MAERAGEQAFSLLSLFIGALIPLRGQTLKSSPKPDHLPKVLSPVPSYWELRVQHMTLDVREGDIAWSIPEPPLFF